MAARRYLWLSVLAASLFAITKLQQWFTQMGEIWKIVGALIGMAWLIGLFVFVGRGIISNLKRVRDFQK